MSTPIFAVIGAKGGSGASTLCVELARTLRRDRKTTLLGEVVVVDGDLSGRRSVGLLLEAIGALDRAHFNAAHSLVDVGGGIGVVEMASSLDAGFTIKPDAVERTVASLPEGVLVLLDAPQPFAGAVRPFIVRATRFVVVLEPTILGVASARALVADLQRFGIPADRIALVVNCRDGRGEVTRHELGSVLPLEILAEVPTRSDRGYGRAIEKIAGHLRKCEPASMLTGLRPSTTAPVGDRRLGRRGNASPAASGGGAGEPAPAPNAASRSAEDRLAQAAAEALKIEIHDALSKRIDLVAAGRAQSDAEKIAELREQVGELAQSLLTARADAPSAEEIARLRQEIIDEAMGYGPLESLLREPDVSEIMVNGPNQIYVERGGLIELSNKRFTDARQLRLIIERIIAPIGRRIDESSPMVDARLPDGSRVNAIIEPLALDGATVTIRRFGSKRLTVEDLVRFGAVTAELVDFLRAAVEARLNIVVSGGTGSGKTTFLNILSGFIPHNERIVTVEDAAELRLNQPHTVRLETRPANIQGKGQVTIRDLVRNSLRMRPDRIVVGECRGGEALDMLQAMNTGHDGSLTTVHANTARDAVSRIETMVLMGGVEMPVRAIREQIASAVDMVVQTSRLRDGSRKIISVSEVVGMESDVVTMQEIVRFDQRGLDVSGKVAGEFQYTGVQPRCLRRFAETGVTYDVRALAAMSSASALW